ncbi:MAG: hypothetical protein HY318_02120 [Armatimonadetes bacterium]|nr:hypothetical protein [Armatimonadota bacterium]
MNLAHIHLLLNHIPVVGCGFGILLLILGAARNSADLLKASLLLSIVVAMAAIPTYFTGEPAEEVVEHLPYVSEPMIEQHEDAAKVAFAVTEAYGVVALASLLFLWRASAIPRWLITTALALSLISGGLMARTAGLGGKIHHQEIREEASLGEASRGPRFLREIPSSTGNENDD